MTRHLQILLFLFFTLDTFSQTKGFVLTLTDTSALDLSIKSTTDREIIDKYGKYFSKPPKHSSGVLVTYCNPRDKGKAIFWTVYEIKFKSLSLTCVTKGIDSTRKFLSMIIITANLPTQTNYGDLILGKTTTEIVEQKYQNRNEVEPGWADMPEFDNKIKYQYLVKGVNSNWYFGVLKEAKDDFKSRPVGRLVISSD